MPQMYNPEACDINWVCLNADNGHALHVDRKGDVVDIIYARRGEIKAKETVIIRNTDGPGINTPQRVKDATNHLLRQEYLRQYYANLFSHPDNSEYSYETADAIRTLHTLYNNGGDLMDECAQGHFHYVEQLKENNGNRVEYIREFNGLMGANTFTHQIMVYSPDGVYAFSVKESIKLEDAKRAPTYADLWDRHSGTLRRFFEIHPRT